MSDLDPNGEGGLLRTRDEAVARLADGLDLPMGLTGSAPICPECVAGKCGICARSALDSVTDLIVDCACPHLGVRP